MENEAEFRKELEDTFIKSKILSFDKIIFDAIRSNDDYTKYDAPEVFHPSSTGFCLRQMFIAKYGFNKFFKDNLVRSGRFFIGNMLHTAVEHIVSEKMLIIDCKNEVQIKSKEYANIRFEGKVDMVIDDVPYEFKSSGAKYPLKAPYQANVFQLNTYMGICRWRHGIIVYVSKLDMHTQVFLVNFNPEMFKEAIMKANAVYEAIKTYQYPQEIPYPKCGCFICNEEETYEMVEKK